MNLLNICISLWEEYASFPQNGKCNSGREKCISPVSRSLEGGLMTDGISLSASSIAAASWSSVVHCCSIFLWDLDWKYSARWEPSIWRCRLLSALQRAQMTDLDQIFCMWYFLCIWRAPSKNFVHFFLLWPPQKGRSFHSGCFFQKCCSTTFLAWFFPFTNHATSLHAKNAVRTTFLEGHYNSYKHVRRTSTGRYYLIMTSRKSMWNHRDI